MIRLLKIEWLKIKNYTAFIIVSIFFVIGVVAVNYIIFVVNNNMISQSQAVILTGKFSPFQFDKTWQTTSYAAGWLLLLPALMLIILITNEFTFRTHRQNIIDGWSRLQFIHVKMLMALLVAVFSAELKEAQAAVGRYLFLPFDGLPSEVFHFCAVQFFKDF